MPMPNAPTDSLPQVFLYAQGRPLLVLHAVAAIVLSGSSVHHAVLATLSFLRPHRAARTRLLRLYSAVALIAYVVTFAAGAIVYPRYRYFVRGLFLDRYAPWASNLFDFKENLALIGLPFAIGAFLLARDPAARAPRPTHALYVLFAVGTGAIVVFNTLAGLLCTSVHGI